MRDRGLSIIFKVYNAELSSVYPPTIPSFFFFPHQLPGAAELSLLLLTASTQSFLSHKDSSVLTQTTEMKREVLRNHKCAFIEPKQRKLHRRNTVL